MPDVKAALLFWTQLEHNQFQCAALTCPLKHFHTNLAASVEGADIKAQGW